MPKARAGSFPGAVGSSGYCRQPPSARQAQPDAQPDLRRRSRARPSSLPSLLGPAAFLIRPQTDPIAMADPKPPRDASSPGAWSGRFGEPVAPLVKRYTASVDFDCRLAAVDIAGSLAHARMLAAAGVLAHDDLAAIERGMETIRGEVERGEFAWSPDLEDVHFNIEHRLTALVGEAGKRLHTGRSRNDQVATDLRLWLRGAIDALLVSLAALRARVHRPRGGSRRHDHARLYPSAGRATGHFRSPSARLRSHVRPRRRALRRLPPPREPAAAGKRGARRHELPDRPPARGRRARVRGPLRQFDRRRVRPRLRRRIHRCRRAGDDPRVAVRRGARLVDESALRLRHAGGPLLHRARRSCRRRRIRTSRSSPAARPAG